MKNNLLVLPHEYTKEDQSLWRTAIRRGWKTMRFNPNKPEKIEGFDVVRYYGNVLNKKRIEKYLPTEFQPISPTLLVDLNSKWTIRKIESMKYGELENPLTENRFIKCVDEKWIQAGVYHCGLNHRLEWKGMQLDDLIYVQTPYDYVNELRCFVIDGTVVTASWYRKNKEFCPEFVPVDGSGDDIEVPKSFASAIVAETHINFNPLPRGVVLDFGQGADGQWSLIEANEAWASGLYDNDPEKVFDTIVVSQDNAKL